MTNVYIKWILILVVDVDEWLRQANAENPVQEEDPAPRSSTSMSMKSDSSLDTSQRVSEVRGQTTTTWHEPRLSCGRSSSGGCIVEALLVALW